MNSHSKSRIAITLVVGVSIFLIAVFLPKLILSNAIASMATTQALELILSLLAILVLGKGRFSDYGFRLPPNNLFSSAARIRLMLAGLTALALGGLATLTTLISGANGNPIVKQFTFPQIILFIWVFSSIIEEIFTRGFLQGHLAAAATAPIRFLLFRIDLPTLISAMFFASMHLVLLIRGADLKTMIIILLFTFSVGLLAGHQRAKTGSLIPAIAIHMMANIGGVIGGIIYSIFSLLNGGKLPGM